jgi:hypothetical protein
MEQVKPHLLSPCYMCKRHTISTLIFILYSLTYLLADYVPVAWPCDTIVLFSISVLSIFFFLCTCHCASELVA